MEKDKGPVFLSYLQQDISDIRGWLDEGIECSLGTQVVEKNMNKIAVNLGNSIHYLKQIKFPETQSQGVKGNPCQSNNTGQNQTPSAQCGTQMKWTKIQLE